MDQRDSLIDHTVWPVGTKARTYWSGTAHRIRMPVQDISDIYNFGTDTSSVLTRGCRDLIGRQAQAGGVGLPRVYFRRGSRWLTVPAHHTAALRGLAFFLSSDRQGQAAPTSCTKCEQLRVGHGVVVEPKLVPNLPIML